MRFGVRNVSLVICDEPVHCPIGKTLNPAYTHGFYFYRVFGGVDMVKVVNIQFSSKSYLTERATITWVVNTPTGYPY